MDRDNIKNSEKVHDSAYKLGHMTYLSGIK